MRRKFRYSGKQESMSQFFISFDFTDPGKYSVNSINIDIQIFFSITITCNILLKHIC